MSSDKTQFVQLHKSKLAAVDCPNSTIMILNNSWIHAAISVILPDISPYKSAISTENRLFRNGVFISPEIVFDPAEWSPGISPYNYVHYYPNQRATPLSHNKGYSNRGKNVH